LRIHAKAWRLPADPFGDLCVDLDHAELPPRMKPGPAVVRRLTVDPSGTGMTDADAV